MNDLLPIEDKPKRKLISRKSSQEKSKQAKIKIEITEPLLKEIGEIADSNGFRVYVVGGYVRDVFLNRQRTDFDFTVIGDSIEFAQIVANHFNTKTVIFEKFLTAMVPIGDKKYEFVGTRKEVYKSNSRKPEVTSGTLEDDLNRRDFTVNALAVSLNSDSFGEMTDLFNGVAHINWKWLRTPLDPYVTFSEDPLRMMRAARFASQLGFTVDDECIKASNEMADRLSIISQERITDEFLKILNSPKPSVGLYYLKEMGILGYVFPEVLKLSGVDIIFENGREFNHKDVFHHSLMVLDNVALQTNNTWLRFAALIHDIAKPVTKQFIAGSGWTFHGHEELGARRVEKIFRRMKMPLDKVDYVERLVRLHQRPMVLVNDGVTDSAVRRLAFQAGDALEDLFLLCKCDITTNNPKLSQRYLRNYELVTRKVIDVQEKDKLREFQSPVRGEEIMEICGLSPSRAVGYIKANIENAILDGIIPNNYDDAKAYLLENKATWLSECENNDVRVIKKKDLN